MWCRTGWDDATCCGGLECVNLDDLDWGLCVMT